MKKFGSILLPIRLLVVESRKDILKSQQAIEICKEYQCIVGLTISMTTKDLAENDERCRSDFAAHLTHSTRKVLGVCDRNPVDEDPQDVCSQPSVNILGIVLSD